MRNPHDCSVTNASDRDAMRHQARCHLAAREFVAARRMAVRVLAYDPEDRESLSILGEAHMKAGKPVQAYAPLKRRLRLKDDFPIRLLFIACLELLKRGEEATAERQRALETLPSAGHAHFLLGMLFESAGDQHQAERLYRGSLEIAPSVAAVQHRLGCLLVVQGHLASGIDYLRQAIENDPTRALYLVDLSSALAGLGDFDAARGAAEKALAMGPETHAALHNLGHAMLNLDRAADAIGIFDQALRHDAEHPATRFSRATAFLKAGRYEEGWREYEWRWRDCQRPRNDINAPIWSGEDLSGRRILLHAEQGYGDTLQFVRLASTVAALGAEVTLQVPQPLVRLLSDVVGVTHVVSALTPWMTFDFHCPLASLPLRVGLTVASVPDASYLSVPLTERVRQGNAVRNHMAGNAAWPDLIVGLVWAGDPRPGQARAHIIDRRRSVDLARLAPLFTVPGVRFAGFQLGAAREQIETSGLPVVDVTDGILDFADTAARLSGIDLLIAVDTSIVHLAGGLGMPVWMISRFDNCWRWMENRSDTPWYPGMRILRQSQPGDWDSVIEEARELLTQFSQIYHASAPAKSRVA
ncbi:hypothetical protein NCH01_01320 [Neoasaia chiangmaiensis]|nr:tetratricopeptide repeat protein [Neoasaia chiangmaiensis]GEN13701.1 hypothetical protein NCH01_01320 [Neoasaia chiangmaiensis]